MHSFHLRKRSPVRDRLPCIAVLGTFCLLCVRLLSIVNKYAVNVFMMDQWKFSEATYV